MRQNTFLKKVNKLCHDLDLCSCTQESDGSINCSCKVIIDEHNKEVTVLIDDVNKFAIRKETLAEAFESTLRILKGYGPKPTRSRYSEN